MKLTFKKAKPETGLAGVARPGHQETALKADGLQFGHIALNWAREGWYVRVATKRTPTEEDPAPFVWVRFKKQFDSEPAAREWVSTHWPKIEGLGLHRFTDT